MTAPVRVIPDPWSSTFEPLPEPDAWHGGFCPSHGNGYQQGCPSCPPDGHPLHDLRPLRRRP